METQHGVDGAYYNAEQLPTIVCQCGWRVSSLLWEQAGVEIDKHLKEHNAAGIAESADRCTI